MKWHRVQPCVYECTICSNFQSCGTKGFRDCEICKIKNLSLFQLANKLHYVKINIVYGEEMTLLMKAIFGYYVENRTWTIHSKKCTNPECYECVHIRGALMEELDGRKRCICCETGLSARDKNYYCSECIQKIKNKCNMEKYIHINSDEQNNVRKLLMKRHLNNNIGSVSGACNGFGKCLAFSMDLCGNIVTHSIDSIICIQKCSLCVGHTHGREKCNLLCYKDEYTCRKCSDSDSDCDSDN